MSIGISPMGDNPMYASRHPRAKVRDATFINLADAYLCSDCEAVGDSTNRCPRCQSDALIAVTRAIRRHRDGIRLICVPLEEQAA